MNVYSFIHDAGSLVGEIGHGGKMKQGNNQGMARPTNQVQNILTTKWETKFK